MEMCVEQRRSEPVLTLSSEKVIEVLEGRCFSIHKKGNVYYCNRRNCKEIKFRETIGGQQIFYVNEKWCHTVGKAIDMAVGN